VPRFVDDGRFLTDFGSELFVRCPRCARRALVRGTPAKGAARLSCGECGLASTGDKKARRRVRGEVCDPYFGLPLFLQTRCGRHTLWAINPAHLAFLRRYVAATLREERPFAHHSLVTRLPTWLKRASARAPVLRAVARLEARLRET
jgi:hypothetical protein